MEQYLQLIFVLALAKYALAASFLRRAWETAGAGAVLGIAAWLVWPWVVGQPSDTLARMLADAGTVGNLAAVISLEAVAGIFSAVWLLGKAPAVPSRRGRYAVRRRAIWRQALKAAPGVTVFAAVAAFEMEFFRASVGASFARTAFLYAVITGGGVLLSALVIRKLLPGQTLRLEAKVLLNAAMLLTGIFVNASLTDYSRSDSHIPVDWRPLAVAAAVAAVLVAAGYCAGRLRGKVFFRIKRR